MMDKLKFTHIPTNTLTKKLNKTIDKVNNKFKGNYISKKMKNCLDERNHYTGLLSSVGKLSRRIFFLSSVNAALSSEFIGP